MTLIVTNGTKSAYRMREGFARQPAELKKIYLLEGHGEKDENISVIKTKLEESNYEVAKLHLLESMQEGRIQIPEDAAVILVVGPLRDFLPAEIGTLRDYVLGGGKAVFHRSQNAQSL